MARRGQATISKFQTPSSKEAPSSKLKKRPARCLPRHLVWVCCLRFGTSLGLELWSLVFRSAAAPKPRCARGGESLPASLTAFSQKYSSEMGSAGVSPKTLARRANAPFSTVFHPPKTSRRDADWERPSRSHSPAWTVSLALLSTVDL